MKKIIYGVSIGLVVLLTSALIYSTMNSKKDSPEEKPVQRVLKNEANDSAEAKPKNYESHKDLKVDKKYSNKNLDLSKIPDTKSVKELTTNMVSLTNSEEIKSFLDKYELKTTAKYQLPGNGERSVVKFKDDYMTDITDVNVSVNYETLEKSKIDYLVEVEYDKVSIYFKLTFKDMVLENIEQLS